MPSRRSFVKRGIAGVTIGAAVGLAGCTQGTGSPTTTGSTPGSGGYNAPAWFTGRGDLQHTASANGSISLPLQERWKKSVGTAITASPVGGHGNVLIGTVDGELHALDPTDGSTAWSYDAGTAIDSAPTAVSENKDQDKYVWVSDRDGAVHSVDPSNGTGRWTTSSGAGTTHSGTNYATGLVYQIYSPGQLSSTLRAIDGQSGSTVWSKSLGNLTTSSPMHGMGSIHTGIEQSGQVYRAFEDKAGTAQWNIHTLKSGASSYTSGVLDTDVPKSKPARIFVSTRESYVSGRRAGTGGKLWQKKLPNFGTVFGLALTQNRSSNTLVVAQKRAMYGFDPATGNRKWTYTHANNARDASTGRTAQPAIYGDYVFQVVGGSKLVAVSLSSGTEEWSASLDGSSTYSSPAVGGKTVYVGDSDGNVYAFSP